MRPIPTLSESDLARFWSKVDKSGECWLWTSYSHVRGYGHFYMDGVTLRANRISYAIANKDPGELNVNHTCDNPCCVNPDHLWVGTQQEGMDDKVAKDRQDKGESHGNHILTEEQAKKILESDEPYHILAERYGVNRVTVSDLKRNKTWTHLEGKRHIGPLRPDNKTGVKGVSPIRKSGLYDARFKLNKKLYSLGQFKTIEKAAQAITKKRLELSCETD